MPLTPDDPDDPAVPPPAGGHHVNGPQPLLPALLHNCGHTDAATGTTTVLCPKQAGPGHLIKLQVQSTGMMVDVVVPDGVVPGSTFEISTEGRVLGVAKYLQIAT